MAGEFKTSGASMSTGALSLFDAARQIDAANTTLTTAYGKLQAQWTSSNARLLADKDYAALEKCLAAMTGWAKGGGSATDQLNELFGKVETHGAFAE